MDNLKIREALTDLLNTVAEQARQDAASGQSHISDIFTTQNTLVTNTLKPEDIEKTIKDIETATKTKEGARRLMSAIMAVAKLVASNVK